MIFKAINFLHFSDNAAKFVTIKKLFEQIERQFKSQESEKRYGATLPREIEGSFFYVNSSVNIPKGLYICIVDETIKKLKWTKT